MSHYDWMIRKMADVRGMDDVFLSGHQIDDLARSLLDVAKIMRCTVEDLAVAFGCPEAVAARHAQKAQPDTTKPELISRIAQIDKELGLDD